jgi:antirestriction protein ArdC
MKTDIYQQVTDQILASLENGTAPWVKPWRDDGSALLTGAPLNRISKAGYNGINVLLLWAAAAENGYSDPTWLTYKQAASLGGNVIKGEKGTRIVFFKQISKEATNSSGETEKSSFGMLRGYTVFNIEQCENVTPLDKPVPRAPVLGSAMLLVAAAIGARVDVEGNKACFIPSADVVKIPHLDQFTSAQHFEATLSHELVHWTGHKSRLDRDFAGRFGSSAYAAEELVAEIGSAFISAEYGFCIEELRHAAYVESWIKVLKSDKKAIFTAASKAQAACNHIKDLANQPAAIAA